jgi:hypothetical protein
MSIYVPGKLVLRKWYIGTDDPDAEAYIAAVEAADEAASPGIGALETATKVAIHSFVKGAKADGFWPAIKASCILAGARTRLGALTPLVGTAPTSINFVDGDYNRKTGLVGDGSTKYLNSNRLSSADPQNSFHLSLFVSTAASSGTQMYIGGQTTVPNDIYRDGANLNVRSREGSAVYTNKGGTTEFIGHSRAVSAIFTSRIEGSTQSNSSPSNSSSGVNIFVFARNSNGSLSLPTDARLAFYSIGESLDLALLDARVTDLINAFAAAIP